MEVTRNMIVQLKNEPDRDHSKLSECPTCRGRTFFTFSTIISPLCVKDCKCTCGNLMAVTKKGPAFAQSSLLCFGRMIIASWPTCKLAVTGSGGICTALRYRYCLWAARAALCASCTYRCTADAYCWRVEIVGSGTAEIISDGGDVPNMRR
jgi:hypothetical protein